ncbi:MAG: WecB/TagA/CpsF family glycosyltransferase [Desulfobacterales bacterium]|nr:WecB/TagA/CpsF family glycosyltransferase [Desulfobacterales bacterium]
MLRTSKVFSGKSKNDKNEWFKIFGTAISAVDLNGSVEVMKKLIYEQRASYVCLVNVHVLMTVLKDSNYQRIIRQSDWVFPDGMPLCWYARRVLKAGNVERVAGHSLMDLCFSELGNSRHFFYGSTPETLNKVQAELRRVYPKVNIVGTFSPPFRELDHQEKREIGMMIDEISPDVIWVALGAPKQERWMWEMRNSLNKGVMIGVGAAFDYFAGNIRRPPVWLRRMGLEWLYRLYQEPRRLWRRYLVTNSLFIFYLFREIVSSHLKR